MSAKRVNQVAALVGFLAMTTYRNVWSALPTPVAPSTAPAAEDWIELIKGYTAIVVVFFLVLFNRGLRIAYQARSSYGMLVGAGLTTILAPQTFLNIGGVTKFVPLTGITLPFISHGGSSLLTGFLSVGLMLAISDGEASRGRRKRTPAKTRQPQTASKRTPPKKSIRNAARKRTT